MPSSLDDPRVVDRLDAVNRWLDAELAGQPVPPVLVVIGLGDGSLLDLLDRRAPQTRVLALEPDPTVARAFLQQRDWRGWRETGRLAYLVDPDYAGKDDAWRLFPAAPDAHKLLVSPGVSHDGGAVRAAKIAKHILFGVKANAEARRRFAPKYLSATLHNLPEIVRGHDIRGLANAFAGVPAILAAAGPSLDTVINDLRDVRQRGLLIAADTALRPLLLHGIEPDLVVAVDPGAANARHFHTLPACPRTWLVSETSIDPSVPHVFGDRAFWFRVANHEPWPWLNELGIDVGKVDVWGSVLTAAFQVAVHAGCDPIVFAGADLSFSGGRPYARGTTYEFDWAHLQAEGSTIADAWRPFLKPDEQNVARNCRGGETTTTAVMQSFRDWIVARAQRSGRRVINATGAGILFGEGIEQSTLRDVLGGRPVQPRFDVSARTAPAPLDHTRIVAALEDASRRAGAKGAASAPFDRWQVFSGDGYNPKAVRDVLDRASRALKGTEAGSGGREAGSLDPAVPIPWHRLSDATRTTFTELPEAIARLRAVYEGRTPAVNTDEPTRAALLGDALEVLREIAAAVEQPDAEDLAAPVPQEIVGRAPLGALRTWPQQLGWAIRLCEGLLGRACSHAIASSVEQASAFYDEPVTPSATARRTDRSSRRSKHPHLDHAGVLLALEWLLIARQSTARDAADADRAAAWWRRVAAAVATPIVRRSTSALIIETGSPDPVAMPLSADGSTLTRLLTGALHDGDQLITLGGVEPAGTLRLALDATAPRVAQKEQRATAPQLIVPRVLTDGGVARSVFAYSTPAGAVSVPLHGDRSVVVGEDGVVSPHLSWPRPINGELPFGAEGAVAWGVGKATWPDGGRGYVMFRPAPDRDVTIEELPFGPTTGVLHDNRMYWTCYPFGVGTWAPGETPTFSADEISLYSVLPDADGFVLHPRVRSKGGATERRFPKTAFSWQPGRTPAPVPLDAHGPASSRAVSGAWTATAYPEADLVHFTSAGGHAVSMVCYYPFAVAWAGRSLVICTSQGDVLLFERVIDALETWSTR